MTLAWSIMMTRVLEHFDDKRMEHCVDKGMEHYEYRDHGG